MSTGTLAGVAARSPSATVRDLLRDLQFMARCAVPPVAAH
jgi:hypothetical protein